MDLRERAEGLSRDIPALKSGKAPFLEKSLAFLAVAYALSPMDLIPDFIPVVAFYVILAYLAIRLIGRVTAS